jgi:hypothetical protein
MPVEHLLGFEFFLVQTGRALFQLGYCGPGGMSAGWWVGTSCLGSLLTEGNASIGGRRLARTRRDKKGK